MAALQASTFSCSSCSSSSQHLSRGIKATLQAPKIRLTVPRLPARDLVEEFSMRSGYTTTITTLTQPNYKPSDITRDVDVLKSSSKMVAELYALMEAIADRAEMHTNIGEQRNNWNHLLLTSINAITLTAATMVGLAATTCETGTPLLALKLSSTLLYSAATGMLVVMNKIQPSQLEIQTTLAIGNPTRRDVKDAMDKVLALDGAYPLPLLGTMLDKFPRAVEPRGMDLTRCGANRESKGSNGWNVKLEEEMKRIVGVLKRKDTKEYVRLGKLALKSLAGAPAAIVNTMEHGGQVGMVFEMYRSNAGFFQLMEESIESTLKEGQLERRENGELFEMKVALQLGRSLSELRDLAASSSSSSSKQHGETTKEFASKLF
ncbi:hypothetical protein NE237_033146 [Protea cynaroides]|uniref:F-box protein n=1 Tax=Protea cynaroides TaxID=273540 RepID=A0A9Q0L4N7_9MAGN|nr:hypothetical protein NE237_033146 [Protea cynaroides]